MAEQYCWSPGSASLRDGGRRGGPGSGYRRTSVWSNRRPLRGRAKAAHGQCLRVRGRDLGFCRSVVVRIFPMYEPAVERCNEERSCRWCVASSLTGESRQRFHPYGPCFRYVRRVRSGPAGPALVPDWVSAVAGPLGRPAVSRRWATRSQRTKQYVRRLRSGPAGPALVPDRVSAVADPLGRPAVHLPATTRSQRTNQ